LPAASKKKNNSSPGLRASLIAGVLLALSFPQYGHPSCAWIALVPLLIALSGWRGRPGVSPGQPPLRAFTLGLITACYFLGTIYWTGAVLVEFGGLPGPLGVVAALLLASYLAIYPSIGTVILARLIASAGARALLIAPAVWVATEYVRGVVFGGFPWVPLEIVRSPCFPSLNSRVCSGCTAYRSSSRW
jgi:apolipoprotein N-acyltransferase